MHQLEEHQGRDEIVRSRDYRRRTETPLEADCQIDERDEERQNHRDKCSLPEFVTHPGTDGLGSDDAHITRTVCGVENLLDLLCDCCRACGLRCNETRLLRPDGELARRAELLDLRTGHPGRRQARPQVGHVDRLPELRLHKGPARKFDAVVDWCPQVRREADQQESDGESCRPFPPSDEIVARVLEYSQHQMLRACALLERLSHTM